MERARTVKGWLPRRLGGGLGGTRRGGPEVNIKHSGREDNVREKERYRLEREKEDRRGGADDRRGDRKFQTGSITDGIFYIINVFLRIRKKAIQIKRAKPWITSITF